jgi:hypothetical protein
MLNIFNYFPIVSSSNNDSIVFGPIIGFNYDRSMEDEAYNIISTQDGGYAIVGLTNEYDLWLIKTDYNGTMEWNTPIEKSGEQMGYTVLEIPGEGFLIGGYGGEIVKIDQNGDIIWQKFFEITDVRNFIDLQNGNFLIGGFNWLAGDKSHFWIGRINNTGELDWEKTYELNGGICYDIKRSQDGGFIFLGSNYKDMTYSNTVILKTDLEGDKTGKWNLSLNELNKATLIEIPTGFIIAGMYNLDFDFIMLKYSLNGSKQWQKNYSNNNNKFGSAIPTNEGGYYLTGSIWVEGRFETIWSIKTDETGIPEWNKSYSGDIGQRTNAVIQTIEGGYAMVGEININYNQDVYFIFTDESGNPLYYFSEKITSQISWIGFIPVLVILLGLSKVRRKRNL